jgi:hypothetical protein
MMDHGDSPGALKHPEHCTGMVSRCCTAITLWNLGYPDQALKKVKDTLVHALAARNPENWIFAYLGTARVHMGRKESKKALGPCRSTSIVGAVACPHEKHQRLAAKYFIPAVASLSDRYVRRGAQEDKRSKSRCRSAVTQQSLASTDRTESGQTASNLSSAPS